MTVAPDKQSDLTLTNPTIGPGSASISRARPTRSTPLTTLYPYLKYGPPPTVQAPIAMTYFGSDI